MMRGGLPLTGIMVNAIQLTPRPYATSVTCRKNSPSSMGTAGIGFGSVVSDVAAVDG